MSATTQGKTLEKIKPQGKQVANTYLSQPRHHTKKLKKPRFGARFGAEAEALQIQAVGLPDVVRPLNTNPIHILRCTPGLGVRMVHCCVQDAGTNSR